MGLPEIFISFETAAASAIRRSSRGVVCLLLEDGTAGGETVQTYEALSEVPQELFTAENYRTIALAFRAAPRKVIVVRLDENSVAVLESLAFDWLAAPCMEAGELVEAIRFYRNQGRSVKAVVANADMPDCEGIVNLCVDDLVLEDGTVTAEAYTARIAGLLAALPLTHSATYAALPEVVSCGGYADPDEAVHDGKLIIVGGSSGYRLGRAVTSLTTLTAEKGAPFQKIKILEGIDLIRSDIARAFESGYVGKVSNDYDSKLLLVTAINGYLAGLAGDVLDKAAVNRCFVSLKGQKNWLQSHGVDTSGMTDAAILRANTGSQVFLEASLTFCDAMEDLYLVIAM